MLVIMIIIIKTLMIVIVVIKFRRRKKKHIMKKDNESIPNLGLLKCIPGFPLKKKKKHIQGKYIYIPLHPTE